MFEGIFKNPISLILYYNQSVIPILLYFNQAALTPNFLFFSFILLKISTCTGHFSQQIPNSKFSLTEYFNVHFYEHFNETAPKGINEL